MNIWYDDDDADDDDADDDAAADDDADDDDDDELDGRAGGVHAFASAPAAPAGGAPASSSGRLPGVPGLCAGVGAAGGGVAAPQPLTATAAKGARRLRHPRASLVGVTGYLMCTTTQCTRVSALVRSCERGRHRTALTFPPGRRVPGAAGVGRGAAADLLRDTRDRQLASHAGAPLAEPRDTLARALVLLLGCPGLHRSPGGTAPPPPGGGGGDWGDEARAAAAAAVR
eukprot:361689-Prorocentrum_minimum.AAC.2